METFKYSVLALELAVLPEELLLVDRIRDEFQRLPHGADTLFQSAGSVDDAAKMIDDYKAKTCGSAYNLAVINLNLFESVDELKFLLSASVLGDPRTVFLATMRSLQAPIYAWAREKVEREADGIFAGNLAGAPSCVDSYVPSTREETAQRDAQILSAYIEDLERRTKAKQTGTYLPVSLSVAAELMRKSSTLFCGRRPGSKTGFYAPVGRDSDRQIPPPADSSGRYPRKH